MWTDIQKYIQKCETCQQSKSNRHQSYRKLQLIPQLPTPWKQVAMDFIVKLPRSTDSQTEVQYDTILTITDMLTKYGKFIPIQEKTDALTLANIITKKVIADHRLPDKWIINWDTRFTSQFWTILMENLEVKHKASTAYHPQTDGQME